MPRLLLFTLLISTACGAPLTLEAIYSQSGLSGPSLMSPKFSPDGSVVTYLKGRSQNKNHLDLWAYEISSKTHSRLVDSDHLLSGKKILSNEEKARRERLRIHASGIISYQWSKNGDTLLFPLGGDLFLYKLSDHKTQQLTQTDAFELDAKFSPDGKKLAFVREQNLIVLDLASGQETALTTDGAGPIKNAMADFVAQEEMGRHTGYWWAPDSASIAYTQFDESPVTEVKRSEVYSDRIETIKQRYPYTGKNNVLLKLGIVSLAYPALSDQKTRWLDLGEETEFYLPRVQWSSKSHLLTYQWQSRDQQHLELRSFNVKTGRTTLLAEEKCDTWVNLHDDLHFLKDGSFIWASERSGFKHLYHIKGSTTKQLTNGKWQVHSIEAIDQKNGHLFFTGWINTPIERHLYRVPLDGSALTDADLITQVSTRQGWHTITFSKDSTHYFDSYSNVLQPPQVSVHQASGECLDFILENKIDASHPLHLFSSDFTKPASGMLRARDDSALHYRYYRPQSEMPKSGYPVIVYLYGGPHVGQQVRNAWSTNNLWAQYLAQQGYVVFTLDNRGSPNRGKKFEEVIYKHLAKNELQDQLTGINWLKQQRWTDNKRFGIHGHSYGGYMTLMSMFRFGDTFAAGIAGAPVTDFRLYDTHYTERYLSTPQKNAAGYDASAVFNYTSGLQGDLLILHGMADDNVLFTNTTKLVRKLQDEGKLFEFMAYPGEKHGISSPTATLHMRKMMADFFQRKIGSPQ